jgi:hypothetical protein
VAHHTAQLRAAPNEYATDLDYTWIIGAKTGALVVCIDLNQHRNAGFRLLTGSNDGVRLVEAVQYDGEIDTCLAQRQNARQLVGANSHRVKQIAHTGGGKLFRLSER